MDKDILQKQLNKCVEVVEATFAKFNLQLLGYGFCGINEGNGWLQLLLEIALLPGEKLEEDVRIKANFYDEENTIIYSYEGYLDIEEFSGYDTIDLCLNEDNLCFNTSKCRIFATKG